MSSSVRPVMRVQSLVPVPSMLRVPSMLPVLALVLAAACAVGEVQREPAAAAIEADVSEAVATITAGDVFDRVAVLAHDSMRGRDTPSPELERAASWLAARFDSFGLEPAGEDGSFLQRYGMPLRALDTTSVHFGTIVDGENRMLEHGVDFYASPATPFEDAAMGHGRLVWIGREGAGDLTTGPEVAGQVAVVELPGTLDREWRIGAARARRSAEEAGARALLVVLGPEFPARAIERFAELGGRPRRTLVQPGEIPVFYVNREAARGMLARGGVELGSLAPTPAAPVVVPGVDSHFTADARVVEDSRPANVAAMLRGSDPALADTYVVLTAHYDHVGVGTADASGDSIYNGADDNASGTVAIVEVAQAFAALSEPPARSVIFLAVSGEEQGLLGSRWYSDHPTVPIESIVANVNVDMIARNAPDSIVVIGQDYSSLGGVVQGVAVENPDLGLTVAPDLWPEERFFFRSDHFNFARKEIPALFFFTGVHEDYHRPSDEIEKIDPDKAARVARLLFLTIHEVADARERPRWDPAGLEKVRELTR